MRRADCRQSQIGERQTGDGSAGVRVLRLHRAGLGFQQPRRPGAVQKGQHRDLFTGDDRKRQQNGAGSSEPAGRRRGGQSLAPAADGGDGGRQRNQCESRRAGRDHLRRFHARRGAANTRIKATPALPETMASYPIQKRGCGNAQPRQRAQHAQSIESDRELPLTLRKHIAHRDNGIRQACTPAASAKVAKQQSVWSSRRAHRLIAWPALASNTLPVP